MYLKFETFYFLSSVLLLLPVFPIIPLHFRYIMHLIAIALSFLFIIRDLVENPVSFPIGVRTHNMIRLEQIHQAGEQLRDAIRNHRVGYEDAIAGKQNLLKVASTYLNAPNDPVDKFIEKEPENPLIIPSQNLKK